MIGNHLINSLVAMAYNNLKEESVVCYKKIMHPLAFREEFGTVHIQLPRGMGHTTEGINLLLEYPESVMIVHSVQWRHMALQNCNNHLLYRIVSLPETKRDLMRFQAEYFIQTHPAPMLIIDTYTRLATLNGDQLRSLLELANPHYELFVLLE